MNGRDKVTDGPIADPYNVREIAQQVARTARHVSADTGCALDRPVRLSVEFAEGWDHADVSITNQGDLMDWLMIDEQDALTLAVTFLSVVGILREARGADSKIVPTEPEEC